MAAPPPDAEKVADDDPLLSKPKDWLSQEELMRQANTVEHMYDNREFNPYCKHCCRAKAQRTRRNKDILNFQI